MRYLEWFVKLYRELCYQKLYRLYHKLLAGAHSQTQVGWLAQGLIDEIAKVVRGCPCEWTARADVFALEEMLPSYKHMLMYTCISSDEHWTRDVPGLKKILWLVVVVKYDLTEIVRIKMPIMFRKQTRIIFILYCVTWIFQIILIHSMYT